MMPRHWRMLCLGLIPLELAVYGVRVRWPV
jgi:hypothetical protein